MTDKQYLSGMIAYSLLYSLTDMKEGRTAIHKLMRSFNRKFKHLRDTNRPKIDQLGIQANKALQASMLDFPDGISMVVSKVIYIWMKREPETFLPFKTNIKFAQALARAGNEDGANLSSAKVVTSLINQINKETECQVNVK